MPALALAITALLSICATARSQSADDILALQKAGLGSIAIKEVIAADLDSGGVKEVLDLKKAGLDDEIIIEFIKSRKKTQLQGRQENGPSAATGERDIVFVADKNPEEIWLIGPDGMNLRRLQEDSPFRHRASPKWSPSGDKVAFLSFNMENDKHIFIAKPGSEESYELFLDFPLEEGESRLQLGQFDWSNDGNKLILESIGEPGGRKLGIFDLLQLTISRVSIDKEFYRDGDYYDFSFGPGDKYLLYTLFHTSQTGNTIYHTYSLWGFDLFRNKSEVILSPGFRGGIYSPDGSKLLFSQAVSQEDVWQLAYTGSALDKDRIRKVPTDYSVHSAAWSPDGTRIAICVGEKNSRFIASVNLATGESRILTSKDNPHWRCMMPDW